jgi:hypothetical protein
MKKWAYLFFLSGINKYLQASKLKNDINDVKQSNIHEGLNSIFILLISKTEDKEEVVKQFGNPSIL